MPINVKRSILLAGHIVVVKYGDSQVVTGKLLGISPELCLIGKGKTDIPHPVDTPKITNLVHQKLECTHVECVRAREK